MSDESELQSATEPLTDRQKQVMELIARGFTNPQIAEKLGITLDGAKWHVREILTKVGAENREEAVAWWRREHRPSQRLQRAARVLVSATVLRIAAGVAVVVIAGVLGTLALIALKDDEPPAAADNTATAAATATATTDTTPTPIAPPTTVGGKPVTQLAPGAPIEFPDDLVLYVAVSGCANCGFGGGDLWRIYRGNDGQLTADHAEPPGSSALEAVSVDGATIISGICSGYCGGEGFPSETAVMRFVISHDGGITWQDVPSPLFERTEFWFGGWYEGEVVATAIKYQPSNQIECRPVVSDSFIHPIGRTPGTPLYSLEHVPVSLSAGRPGRAATVVHA